MVEVSEVELSTAEFKGYVKGKLEGVDEKLDKLDKKLDLLDSGVSGMKIKVAVIGGTISLVVTIVVLLLKSHI